MPRGRPHSDETRAAVLAALLAGQSVNEVAREFRLSNATVIAWRDAAGLGSTTIQPEKRRDVATLVIGLMEKMVHSIEAQIVFTRDPGWLQKQSAAELATLIGVTSDKVFRIVSAMDASAEDES